MRVQYQYGNDAISSLKIFHQDDTIGDIKNNLVTMRLSRLIQLLQSAHAQGRLNRPLVIAKVKKGDRDG